MTIEVRNLDHLGLVAGLIDEIGIEDGVSLRELDDPGAELDNINIPNPLISISMYSLISSFIMIVILYYFLICTA